MDPLSVLYKDLGKCVPLDREQAAELARRWRDCRDFDARVRLILSVTPWAMKLAMHYHNLSDSCVSKEDLISEAMEGLILGVDHFDPDRGLALTTYVTFWIRRGILRYLETNKTAIRVPMGIAGQLRKALQQGEEVQRGDSSLLCLAARASYGVLPLADAFGEAARSHDGSDRAEMLCSAISRLPPRLEKVMTMRLEGCTLETVGNSFGLTKERARQLETNAKEMLRKIIGED